MENGYFRKRLGYNKENKRYRVAFSIVRVWTAKINGIHVDENVSKTRFVVMYSITRDLHKISYC